jgi:hypothetical protein
MVRQQATAADRIRQGAVLLLAVAQAAVTAAAGSSIQERVDTGPRSPVEPAAYAFAIWGAIFLLCIAYGVWQALPAQGVNPLLRRIGWPTAGAFLTIVGWSIVVPFALFWAAQLLLLATWMFLAVAAVRLADAAAGRPLSAGERWFSALPLAPFFGWVTAANGVSLHGQAVDLGLVAPDGTPSRLLGALLILAVGVVAGYVVHRAQAAPPHFWAVYAATVLWAVVAIAVAQWAAEPVIAVAAILAAVPTLIAIRNRSVPPRPRRPVSPLPA